MNQNALLIFIRKYKKKGVLIDTNLALLYVVGTLDPLLIRNHKRTAMFRLDDFYRLSKFVDVFDIKITTPNILTEIGNLLGKGAELRGVFSGFINKTNEKYVSSRTTAESHVFSILGLTDAGILEVAKNKYLVVTDDGPLEDVLRKSGIDVVSLSQIREI